MDGKDWIQAIIEVLEEFSSQEFQERIWLKGLGPEVSSYEEAMCRLFDDLGLSLVIDDEWHRIGLNENQRDALKEFKIAIDSFDKDIVNPPHPLEVLQHLRWPEIRELAKQTLQILTGSTAPYRS